MTGSVVLKERNCIGVFSLLFFITLGSSKFLLAESLSTHHQTLLHLLRHDCGSCHGLRLLGGLGPPLTPTALTGRSKAYLEDVIYHGVPNMAMPPWKAILSREDIRWLVDRLLEGPPP